MGTRGIVGFVVKGEQKLTYNHFDSYPEELGVAVLESVRRYMDTAPALLRERAAALELVNEFTAKGTERKATKAQLARLAAVGILPDTDVGTRGPGITLYQALRSTQGDLDKILDSGLLIDSAEFAGNGLFCEWGYVIDLDGDGVLEVYRGFVEEEHQLGRFASLHPRSAFKPSYKGERYYAPIALIKQYALAQLPDKETFLAEVREAAEALDKENA